MSSENWERFVEDLEHQFARERAQEERAQQAERDRARVAGTSLRDRLAALAPGARLVVDDAAGLAHRLRLEAVGADWIAGGDEEAPGVVVVRVAAIHAIRLRGDDRSRAGDEDPLLARMDLGFALRSLARRRAAVTIGSVRGGLITGTPSRVGADHVDLALHDEGASPRASDVREVRLVAFRAIAWVRIASGRDLGGVYSRV